MLRSTLLILSLLLLHGVVHGLPYIPDCSKPKHKEKPACKCVYPINWDKPICLGTNWWEKPAVKETVDKVGKIVGGETAPVDKYPWFARLVRRNGSWAGCGGMLVAPQYVLTAAHCVPNWTVSNAAVQIGAVCLTSNDNCGQPLQQINVESITPHPNYNTNTLNNDYALVKLVSRANATPVAMDQGQYVDNYSASKRNLYAIGFGTLSSGGNTASQLRHVELGFRTRASCNSDYDVQITNQMMCAADPGQDSCQGDSGGPLYDDDNNVLVGIVSWGYGCARPDYPGVYAQVSSRWDWIKSGICADHSNPKPNFCSNNPVTTAPTRPVTPAPAPGPQRPTTVPPTTAAPTLTECPSGELTVEISVSTDEYPSETSWSVGGYSSPTFSEEDTKYDQQLCLDATLCHEFTIKDSYGDGFQSQGDFSLKVNGVTKLSLDDSFLIEKSTKFGTCDETNPCAGKKKRFKLVLTTDQYGEETSFQVKKRKANGKFKKTVFADGEFDSSTEYERSKCLNQKRCYKLVVMDTTGDGICCEYGQGSFQAYWKGDEILNSDSVSFEEAVFSTPFGRCS